MFPLATEISNEWDKHVSVLLLNHTSSNEFIPTLSFYLHVFNVFTTKSATTVLKRIVFIYFGNAKAD